MQLLRYSINVTLDGCCHHEAIVPDEELHRRAAETIALADTLLFGRITYQMMESAWREPGQTGVMAEGMEPWMLPFAETISAKTKVVVSRTLDHVDWNAELARGDLETTVKHLKQSPGRGIFTGGVMLPRALAELGLIDEYEFVVHPRVAGRGPALFAGLSKPLDLELVGQSEYASGAVAMRYVPKRQG